MTNLNEVEFEGILVKIGRKEFIIPPLSIPKLHKNGFYKLQAEFSTAQQSGDLELIGDLQMKLLELIYLAILMNYPEATKEETIELINTKTMGIILPNLVDNPEGLEIAKNVPNQTKKKSST